MRYLPVLLILFICSCAGKTENMATSQPGRNVYTVLPASFIPDVAANAKVTLNPMVQEFIIFSAPDEARKRSALMREATGSDWRVYLLEGNFDDLAQKCGRNNCLGYPTIVKDWLED